MLLWRSEEKIVRNVQNLWKKLIVADFLIGPNLILKIKMKFHVFPPIRPFFKMNVRSILRQTLHSSWDVEYSKASSNYFTKICVPQFYIFHIDFSFYTHTLDGIHTKQWKNDDEKYFKHSSFKKERRQEYIYLLCVFIITCFFSSWFWKWWWKIVWIVNVLNDERILGFLIMLRDMSVLACLFYI